MLSNKVKYFTVEHSIFAFIMIAGLIVFTSCEDTLLEENPKQVVAENFYNTESEVETAVNAIYSPFNSTTLIGNYIVIVDNHTDWGFGRGSRGVLNDFQGLNTTWSNGVGSAWEMFYESIRNANLVLQNTTGESGDQNNFTELRAEAKFLRAFNYFHLVRNWGGIPLRTVENFGEKDVQRSSVEDVYELILSDLTEAEQNLPTQQSQIGRPTTYAAKTMLADVYLHLERYTDARDKAKDIMDANTFSLVPLSTKEDFAQNIFGPDIESSSEEIFHIKFTRRNGLGNFMPFVVNHPSTGLYAQGGVFAHFSNATLPFYKNWDDDDFRKQLWDIIDFGLGDSTLVSRKFPDQNAAGVVGAGNDQPMYRYAEVLFIFAEAAARVAGGPTQEAMEALNKVHRRAFGYDPSTASPVDFNVANYDLELFIDLVVQERGYEFIFEGKRWFTLKRTNKAREQILKNRGIQMADRHFLWPLPNSEINFNDAINEENQNPGY
ncbi:MAG: RagB/SusD family nutrient uptake outer membrane protein [Balneolaceae bacterium]|nr:RagB/SusD family nutrient uptake outer membrane protein [Balneolaceae bacterium]